MIWNFAGVASEAQCVPLFPVHCCMPDTWSLFREGNPELCGKFPNQYIQMEILADTSGQCAFTQQSSQIVKKITIRDGVHRIGGESFKDFTNLQEVVIPSTVNTVLFHAFKDCKNVEFLTFPGYMQDISEYAFMGCNKLKAISVKSNDVYNTNDGVLFKASSTILARFPPAKEGVKEYTIPESVKTIGAMAFEGVSTLRKVVIPKNVVAIGPGAFSNCINLDEISGCEGVSSVSEGVFEGSSVKKNDCLNKTRSRSRDSTPLTFIDEFAFRNSSIEEVIIPSSVDVIGPGAFAECHALKSFKVEISENSVYGSKDGVLFDANITTLIQYPSGREGEYTIPDNVSAISRSSFRGALDLTAVTIPDSVFFIGSNAFKNCVNLKTVNFLGNNDPGENSLDIFDGCEELYCANVPAGYKSTTFCGIEVCSKSSAVSSIPLLLLLVVCIVGAILN